MESLKVLMVAKYKLQIIRSIILTIKNNMIIPN